MSTFRCVLQQTVVKKNFARRVEVIQHAFFVFQPISTYVVEIYHAVTHYLLFW